MAIYRQVQMSFWSDSKIVDDFTPEDKYFYLYLLTNPHTNLAGCYELSMKQASDETGYNRETIGKIIKRMEEKHGVIAYDTQTKEVLIVNWSKYNWIKSEKFRKPLLADITAIKSERFREFLNDKYDGADTVSIPYRYGIDTTVTVPVTDTVSVTDAKPTRQKKTKYGEFSHVSLADAELESLQKEYGETETAEAIKFLDEYIEESGKKYKNHNLTLRRWVFDAVKERKAKKPKRGEQKLDFKAFAEAKLKHQKI